jgi:hypothetical protein
MHGVIQYRRPLPPHDDRFGEYGVGLAFALLPLLAVALVTLIEVLGGTENSWTMVVDQIVMPAP